MPLGGRVCARHARVWCGTGNNWAGLTNVLTSVTNAYVDRHAEYVLRAEELLPAFHRALASGRPACVNVEIELADMPLESIALSRYE
jgi:hypothetical protein